MVTGNDTQTSLCFPVFQYDPQDVSDAELCDQCMALSVAISEVANFQLRDTLNWVLIDRLNSLRGRLSD